MKYAKLTVKDGKYYCQCGKAFLIDAIRGSGIRIITRGGDEFEITFDRIEIRCSKCDTINTLESPIIDLARLTGQHKEIIRAKTNGLDLTKLGLDLPRLISKEKDRFYHTLSKDQEVIYKIIQNPDIESDNAVRTVSKELKLELSSAHIQVLETAVLIVKFKLIIWTEGKKKLSTQEIIELYKNPKKLHQLYDKYEKSLGKDEREVMTSRMQKQIYYIQINAWSRVIRNLKKPVKLST